MVRKNFRCGGQGPKKKKMGGGGGGGAKWGSNWHGDRHVNGPKNERKGASAPRSLVKARGKVGVARARSISRGENLSSHMALERTQLAQDAVMGGW